MGFDCHAREGPHAGCSRIGFPAWRDFRRCGGLRAHPKIENFQGGVHSAESGFDLQ
jgi:hypothetical protein